MRHASTKQQRRLAAYGGAAVICVTTVVVALVRDVLVALPIAISLVALLVTLVRGIKAKAKLELSFFAGGAPTKHLVTPAADYPALDAAAIAKNERIAAISTLPAEPRAAASGDSLAVYKRVSAMSIGGRISNTARFT